MADSTMDTNGLSVASRIRMFQNNLEGDAPPKPKRGISPSGSPKPELTSQPSGGHIGTQILPINATKFAEKIVSSRKASPRQATPQSASPRSSPPRTESPAAIRHKGRDLNLDLKPIRNQTDTQKGQKSPRPSPKPSPRPSPQLERKEFIHADSQKSNKEAQHSNEAKQSVSRTTSQELTKPPLPNKPKSLVIKEGQTKDINDSCNAKSALSGKINKPDYPKKPLVVTVSSGNSTVDEDRNNSKEGREQKAVSEAPSRPLPFGPKSQADGINQHSFSEDAIAEKTEISDAKRKRDDMAHHSYEIVDRVYEEPDSPVQEEEVRYDNEYEDPGPCSPTESTQSSQFNDGDRKVLSRISTSRRPPPLPTQNRRDSKKNAKAPPLPSRNAVHTAEDQALYSYAAEPELFHAKAPSFKSTMQDLSYETPDAGSVRGLMLGLQNNRGDYETPDAASVNEFMSNVNANTRDGCNDYETPDQEAVRDLTCSIQDKKHVAGAYVGSDSDSDAYCDPETVPTLAERPRSPTLPLAPQKSLPPPPPGEGSDQDTSDEDHGHDYEDPTDDLRNRPRHVSLRRASQPVLNPDAYLSLQEMDLDSLYQDPAEAFSTMPNHRFNAESQQLEDEYEDLSDEPLYQVYAADVLSEMRRKSEKGYKEDDVFSEYSTGGIESGQRVLWCQLPSVRNSGVLTDLEPREKKRQEAMFEVITSEASYLKSLNILVNHFMSEFTVKPDVPPEESIVDKQQYRFLFGGLSMIKSTSEKFLHSLRGKQEENFIISSISDIVVEYATKYFECYVKYCSNQVYQERTLMTLVNENQDFCDLLGTLESSTRSQGLSMQSFLMLPMQRITRLPLLVDAICHHCEPGSEEFHKTDSALSAIHKVVKECNEGARKMERIEEMYFIQQMLSFKVKPIPIVSSSRWLLRRGELACLEGEKKIRAFKSLLRGGRYYRIYLFLFNDLLLVTKMKSENNFKVVDHCARGMIHIDDEYVPTGDTLKPGLVGVPSSKFMFTLILLENHQGKTTRYVCFAENETEKIRWLDALTPPKPVCDKDGEKIYEEWDCPQVRAIHTYQPDQPDELTLREGDVIKVLRKLPDGWYEGQHLVGGEQGWFPANHTEEIRNEHTRARNLMQRYRLINTVSMAFEPKAKKL